MKLKKRRDYCSLFWQQHQTVFFQGLWCHSVSCNTRTLKELSDQGVWLWRLALPDIQLVWFDFSMWPMPLQCCFSKSIFFYFAQVSCLIAILNSACDFVHCSLTSLAKRALLFPAQFLLLDCE